MTAEEYLVERAQRLEKEVDELEHANRYLEEELVKAKKQLKFMASFAERVDEADCSRYEFTSYVWEEHNKGIFDKLDKIIKCVKGERNELEN